MNIIIKKYSEGNNECNNYYCSLRILAHLRLNFLTVFAQWHNRLVLGQQFDLSLCIETATVKANER